MSKERRTAQRQRIHWNALIIDPSGSIVAQCLIDNVSASGAKLVLKQAVELPETFILVLSKGGGVRRQCELTWLSEKSVGVRFVRPVATEHESMSHFDEALSRLGHKNDDDESAGQKWSSTATAS